MDAKELVSRTMKDQRRCTLEDLWVLHEGLRNAVLLVYDLRKDAGAVALAPAECVAVHTVYGLRVARDQVRVHRLCNDHLGEQPGHILQLLPLPLVSWWGERHGCPSALGDGLPGAL